MPSEIVETPTGIIRSVQSLGPTPEHGLRQNLPSVEHHKLVGDVSLKGLERVVKGLPNEKPAASSTDSKPSSAYPEIGHKMPDADTVIQSLDAARAAGLRIPEGLDRAVREAQGNNPKIDRNLAVVDMAGQNDSPWGDIDWEDEPPSSTVAGAQGVPDHAPAADSRGHGEPSLFGKVGRFLAGDQSEFQRSGGGRRSGGGGHGVGHDGGHGGDRGHGGEGHGRQEREVVALAERGIRKSVERLTSEEAEGLPSMDEAFDKVCQWYEMDKKVRQRPEHVRELNKNLRYVLYYVDNAKEDGRLVQNQVELENKARKIFEKQFADANGNLDDRARRLVDEKLAEIAYGSFDEKMKIVTNSVVEQAKAELRKAGKRTDGYREFQALEDERMRIRSKFEDLDPNIIRELNINEANGSRAGQLAFLKGRLDEIIVNKLPLSAQQKKDLASQIDDLNTEYKDHPVMKELGEIIEKRSAVVQEIAADELKGVKLAEQKEKLEIVVPEKTFQQAWDVYISEDALEETRQVLISQGIDPKTLAGVTKPDMLPYANPDVDRYVAQLEAKRDIAIYHQIAQRVGLLDEERDNAHQDFLYAEKRYTEGVEIEKGVPATKQRVRDEYIDKLQETDPAFSIEGRANAQWLRSGILYSLKAVDPEIDAKVSGLTPDKLAGFSAYYRMNVAREMVRHLSGIRGEEKSIDGEWSVEDVLASRAQDMKRAEGTLWRIGWSGTYEVLIQSADPSLYREAASSWINNLVKTGVIDREPGALMQKANYFTEALIGKAVEMSGRLPTGERKEFMRKVTGIKEAFNVEIYAYCGELFNHAFNIQNLAAIYQRMNNFIEGMDHWKVAMQLREGQVYGVYMSQDDPEFELMWRMMGPNGQLTGHYAAQIRTHNMMKDRLADKRVGELIWDRFNKGVDKSGSDLWLVGTEAREQNINLLGYDRSRKETKRAYVPQNDELFEIADKNRLWMSNKALQELKLILGEGRTVKEAMRDGSKMKGSDKTVAERVLELAFTPEEQKAIRLRDIKARKAAQKGIIREADKANILVFNREGNGYKKIIKRSDEDDQYSEALGNAKDAVDIYMQLISMTGDKARETGPSYICRATNTKGELVPFLDQATEMDKIPKWRLKRLTTFAKSMAARKIAEYNKGKPRDQQIIRGSKEYVAIMGVMGSKQADINKAIDANGIEWGHGDHHGDNHGATSPWGGDVSHFEGEIGSAVWLTLDAAFKKGWSLELPDFEITADKKLKLSANKKMQFTEKNDDTGEVETKDVTFYTIENHPFAMSMQRSYAAHQLDQLNEIAKREQRKKAELYLNGKLSRSEAGLLAMQLLTIDPALNRIREVADQSELNRYVLAQIEESTLNDYDIERAMPRQFRGFVEWGYMSMMSTGLRRLQNMAEYAMTQDKNTPRARWMETFLQGYTAPVGNAYALPHSFEAIKLIKRESLTEEQAKQEALDPPELESAASMYNIAMEIYSIWLGTEKEPGVLEKPTVSNENLTGDDIEKNDVRLMTGAEIKELYPKGVPKGVDPNHLEITTSVSHQLSLQKKLLDALGRIKPLFDPTLNKMSRNYGADGASDLRQEEIWDYDQNGEVIYELNGDNGQKAVVPAGTEGALPRKRWRIDKIDGSSGARASAAFGRGRHETGVVAKLFTTYAKSLLLKDEKGRLDPDGSGKPYVYNGGVTEYGDAHFWLRHLNVYLKVHDLPAADRKSLPKELQKKRYITFEDFIISKWSRR